MNGMRIMRDVQHNTFAILGQISVTTCGCESFTVFEYVTDTCIKNNYP